MMDRTFKLDLKRRHELGQFFTPAPVARLMAGQLGRLSGPIRLLDPGAGVGSLTAALVERLLDQPDQIESCWITAYEIEAAFLPALKQCLEASCVALTNQGIPADYCLREANFITAAVDTKGPLRSTSAPNFTHAIVNPPYRKIHSQSAERKLLSELGLETTNLYSAFVWLTMLQLQEGGELVAITPRSFCNGAYFRPFRQAFLDCMELKNIHSFESRAAIFAQDQVLQENVVIHAIKRQQQSAVVPALGSYSQGLLPQVVTPDPGGTGFDLIQITRHDANPCDGFSEFRQVPYSEVVGLDDPECFIHIVTDALATCLSAQMATFAASLDDLGLTVSTGPVVDFRLKSHLRTDLDPQSVPLLYPESVKWGQVVFPPRQPRKSIAIERNHNTDQWLVPPGWYVLTKRFSAKEEKRRVVAAVCPPFDAPVLGIENHLNYYHADGQGLHPDLACGLAAFLNSTLVDRYFRQFSGHTQVNATDLRRLKYPCRDDLIRLGRQIGDTCLDQEHLDRVVHQTLSVMGEAIRAIQAGQRIMEALGILKAIAVPKAQQNERSALCLLALADLRPESLWQQATAPPRTITAILDELRDGYGKLYGPNTGEILQQQILQPLVQMGLVVEVEAGADRSLDPSQSWYHLHPQALSLLQAYRSERWEAVSRKFAIALKKQLKKQLQKSLQKSLQK